MADAIITPEIVFDFMGSPATIRDNEENEALLLSLIAEQQEVLESIIGRAILEPLEATDKMFGQGLDSEVSGNKLFLKGKYRDILSITSVAEGDTALTEATHSARDNDYIVDKRLGLLQRVNNNWDDSDYIIITGKFGYLNADETPKEIIKSILTEMVAAKSRLWKSFVETEEGKIETVRQAISSDTQKLIKRLQPANI